MYIHIYNYYLFDIILYIILYLWCMWQSCKLFSYFLLLFACKCWSTSYARTCRRIVYLLHSYIHMYRAISVFTAYIHAVRPVSMKICISRAAHDFPIAHGTYNPGNMYTCEFLPLSPLFFLFQVLHFFLVFFGVQLHSISGWFVD